MQHLEQFFKIKERHSTVRTEIIAGITTFMSMAYILMVNPSILASAGMDHGSVFAATAISAVISTILMGIWANIPVALAPGMGINVFFAYTVVIVSGHSWQLALTAVFIAGILFVLLSLTNFREAVFNCIPMNLKYAISSGIGLFIAFIGFQQAGIIVGNDATLITMGNLATPGPLLTIIGLALISVLLIYKVKGTLLLSIIITAAIGVPMGITNLETLKAASLFNIPNVAPTFWQFDFQNILTLDMLLIVFTFFLINLFNTMGTLVGVAAKANLLNEKGELPQAKPAFLVDAIGTCVGAIFGTSTVTAYVESSSGIAAGGRTGLTALVTAFFFFLALFFAPLFLVIPSQATAPALIMVGLFMISTVVKIDFEDYVTGIPAFLIIIGIPLTYSIAYGIGWGLISYVFLMIFAKKAKQLHPITYILALMFVWKFISG